MRQKLFSITQSLRLPAICILCKQFHTHSTAVCPFCFQHIKLLGPSCQKCALPLPDNSYLICGQCIKNPPYFDRTIVAYTFDEPLRNLLHQFKYHDGLYLGSFLVQLMLNALDKPLNTQCLIPVPLHPARLKLRGFNQAAVLTKLLARRLNLPFELNTCQKKINTAPQASLNGVQRQKNLRHAFSLKPVTYQHVTLIDDLLTTGSTANELALTLKAHGVKQVDIWCCARAIPKS